MMNNNIHKIARKAISYIHMANRQLSIVNRQSSIVNRQLSIVNGQSSTVNRQWLLMLLASITLFACSTTKNLPEGPANGPWRKGVSKKAFK